ncbi:hypothetical protein M0D68_03375 [Paraburkholderia sp. SEWSISQ10-3 4]|uniref:hypothetical protein n=1 Tax=Paraburkholderia TaxID=1822464 RepID=UPI002255AD8D|nr:MULTISPECIES: hypothetical protein [Paraburkholderia]MCX4137206.1 hypothetical protein [Paraburkholderia aspalathi]MDN7169898.1 hypothetical protein [Paraburkholderia sp. SEWSISQ10-3 4]MDQ6499537.1 hypothetical protein [Paraburkholderia aspalathi]
MKNFLIRIALPLVLAASGMQMSVAADTTAQPNAAAAESWNKGARFRHDEVAVLFVMGQSNSAGLNGLPADLTLSGASGAGAGTGGMPAPNVWGIRNDGWSNIAGNADGSGAPFTQPISAIDHVSWVNWSDSTSSDMNLGYYGGSGNAANFAAYAWQSAINAGEPLPDLYIIHIGWGSQGVDVADDAFSGCCGWTVHGVNLWQPMLDASKTPTYALAPFARRMMYLGLKQILATGKKPRILGLEWNQWEAEAAPLNSAGNATTIRRAPQNYAYLFSSFFAAVGSTFPVLIVKPLSTAYDNVTNAVAPYNPAALASMQKVFGGFVDANPRIFSFADASQSPDWNGQPPGFGIFQGGTLGGGDGSVHYNLDTQKWFGEQALAACLGHARSCGPRITDLPRRTPN